MDILLIILLIIFIILIAIGILFYNYVFNRNWIDYNYKKIREKELKDTSPEGIERNNKQKIYDKEKDEFNESVKDISQDIFVKSFDNKMVHARVIENNASNAIKDIWIVGVHGYRNSSYTFGEFINQLYKMGYNVLLPDLRGCGDSKEKYLTMGYKDKYDVKACIDWLTKNKKDSKIVIYGVSMGAATTMMTTGLKLPKNVKCVVEDCGYSSLFDELKYECKFFMHLPAFPVLYFLDLIYMLKNRFVSIKKVSSVDALKKNTRPTLFIHGKNDDFVPYYMLEKVYNANNSIKEKIEFDYTWHAESNVVHKEEYYNSIDKFIKKYSNN